ncbi:cAMP-binding domain of CRP or a regulatory subunit of cAMP-dependent protein kinases [Flagellimonas taeanensis]|uniref:cAMP-binding domain of CRP or a regulatory subunit of cAMP-dependent protein kinases n=1 Tax=Flagellimonas taeanensis TaxID=1005926 RepID=A0A1M6UUX9_9FLAO|nr:Crp/Fnr family transcriptional regulator [Allomuricauda taeanensis]SFC23300.1 cAMP-binding domain of CRP or a regulatory subunit of cAMP-dependent protein kinases [Allomuricauda taeanensis]SHK73040.1 cAMP-binding domain of CRP or a regulatory subunit of cAMP-dependent protein kinases [Allomuricauda taeanensis]
MSVRPTLMEALKSEEHLQSIKRELTRHEYILTPGQVENNIYFIEEGALRLFYVSKNAEHDIRFGYTGNIITSLGSFLSGKTSEYYIQAIRKTILYQVPKKAFIQFVESDIQSLKEYSQLMEQLALQQLERELDLMTDSPLERYNRVLERSPKLFQEIPLKYIASYLRMTPETLSRLRNQ